MEDFGNGNFVVSIDPPAGPQAKPKLAYTIKRSANYVPTPIAVDGLAFFLE
jgi:hypothetical protein